MGNGRAKQFTLSVKVSGEEKERFAVRCARAGLTQSEVLLRAIAGNVPAEQDMPALAREQLMLVHRLRAALADGRPVDAEMLDALCAVTRDLIGTTREALGR